MSLPTMNQVAASLLRRIEGGEVRSGVIGLGWACPWPWSWRAAAAPSSGSTQAQVPEVYRQFAVQK